MVERINSYICYSCRQDPEDIAKGFISTIHTNMDDKTYPMQVLQDEIGHWTYSTCSCIVHPDFLI